MSDVDKRFHEIWLGMAQPIEGLVVSSCPNSVIVSCRSCPS